MCLSAFLLINIIIFGLRGYDKHAGQRRKVKNYTMTNYG